MTLVVRLLRMLSGWSPQTGRLIPTMPRDLDDAEASVLRALDDDVSLDIVQVSCRSLVAPGRAHEAIGALTDRGLVQSVAGSPMPRYLRRTSS